MFYTKLAVITGYVIMVILSISGIVWIYQEWLKYSDMTEPRLQRKELILLSNTLTTLYHAESTAGLLAIETDPARKWEYDSLMTTVFHQIRYLQSIDEESVMQNYLDSLNLLLIRKQQNITELAELVHSFQTHTVKKMTHTTVLSQKDLDALDNLLVNTIQFTQDTTKIVGEKKGFFRRIGDAIKSSSPDTLSQVSSRAFTTQQEAKIPIIKDTIVNMILEVNRTTLKRNAEITAQLMLKQNELYSVNECTTAQINRIMNELETSELNENLQLANERTETIRLSSVIISIIALAAIVLALIFMSFILHSITKSQRLQRQIEEKKKNVEKLLASREQLMLTVTHDIKAPVSSILGYLELMMKDRPSLQEGSYIQNMQHSAIHILDLIRNLLDFHSLEIQQPQPENLVFSPGKLLTDIYESFIPDARKKDLKFEYQSKIDKQKQYVSDPYRIRQIVANIISNAIKYTPVDGSVVLSAKLVHSRQQTTLNISVRDTGPGIKEQDKEQVFEAFKRLDYTGKGIDGFGLGLNISYRLAKLLGGSVSMESTVGKGSVFTVSVPLPAVDTTAAKSVPRKLDRPPLKVLFIDDDNIQLSLLSKIVEREGMKPYTCSGSLQAFEMLQEERFDIIFSDIQMPDMNGLELVERIRRSGFEGAESIPIIGLSAHSYIPESKQKETGFTAFLSKPFTSAQLVETIDRFTGPNKALNFNLLIEFAGGDPGAGKSIIHSFIAETGKDADLLEKAFETADWSNVKNITHKMLPLMKMISANRAVAFLETYSTGRQDTEHAGALLKEIRKIIETANRFITHV